MAFKIIVICGKLKTTLIEKKKEEEKLKSLWLQSTCWSNGIYQKDSQGLFQAKHDLNII